MGLEEELKEDIEAKIKFLKDQIGPQVSEYFSKKLNEPHTLELFSRFLYREEKEGKQQIVNLAYPIITIMSRLCFTQDYDFYIRKFIGFLWRKQSEGEKPENIVQELNKQIPLTYDPQKLTDAMNKLI